MKLVEVILKEDVLPFGEQGDIKNVRRGFAVNYLFPRKLAIPKTEKALKILNEQRAEIEKKKIARRNFMDGLHIKLRDHIFEFIMKTVDGTKLFASVHLNQVLSQMKEILTDKEYDLVKHHKIVIPQIRSVGIHYGELYFAGSVFCKLKIAVVDIVKREEELNQAQAEAEANLESTEENLEPQVNEDEDVQNAKS